MITPVLRQFDTEADLVAYVASIAGPGIPFMDSAGVYAFVTAPVGDAIFYTVTDPALQPWTPQWPVFGIVVNL